LPIAEPMTVFTDYGLAAVGVALALRLERRADGHLSRRLWAACFLAVALAAVAGGTSHGWAPRMGEAARAALWLLTYALVGLGNFFILTGAVVAAVRGGVRTALTLALVLRFAIWFAFISMRPDFRYVVYDYAGTLLGLLVFAAWLARRRRPGAWWIVAGVLVSLGGALVQRGGHGPHPDFNHNDLFHVIQAVGLYLYFRAGRLLADAGTAPGKAGHNSGATLGRRS
jgi:hypothetical protein